HTQVPGARQRFVGADELLALADVEAAVDAHDRLVVDDVATLRTAPLLAPFDQVRLAVVLIVLVGLDGRWGRRRGRRALRNGGRGRLAPRGGFGGRFLDVVEHSAGHVLLVLGFRGGVLPGGALRDRAEDAALRTADLAAGGVVVQVLAVSAVRT